MSELVGKLRSEFQDEEYRHSYAEECLNTMIATQIKVLREQREMTQSTLAKKAEMLQPRLSVMENADYSSWSVSTLKRLARAFDLAITVKFEEFSEVVLDFEEMSKETLSRLSFKDDPMFRSAKVKTHRAFRRRRYSESDRQTAEGLQMNSPFMGQVVELPHPVSRNNAEYSQNLVREDSNESCVGIAG
jgi:transcriptional regulator with XRE-family HTH domain